MNILEGLSFIWISFNYMGHDVQVQVANDYIKDSDGYVMASGIDAHQLSNIANMRIPTPEIVDAIYEKASCKLKPLTSNPALKMSRENHNKTLQQKIDTCIDTELIAGHKKDIVVSDDSSRVAIYGWHQLTGKPIQPYSTVHGMRYADYSHGIRLIGKMVILNGKIIHYNQLLKLMGYEDCTYKNCRIDP